MVRRLLAHVGILVASTLAPLTASGHAADLTEVRISQVSCRGLRATQTGLPPRTPFEVKVIDPDTVTTLKVVRVTADGRGRLDARIAVSLRGLLRVLVEVERADGAEAEYGEAGTDLRLPCTPPTTTSSAGPQSSQQELGRPAVPGSTARTSTPGRPWVPVVAGGAVLLVILAAILRGAGRS
jgi:hypothetical protein